MIGIVTETQIWADFLLKQLPVIVVLSIFCYCMYKYFTKTIEQKDASIKEKDEEIKELHEKLLNVTKQCIEASNKNSDASNGLKDVIQMALRKFDK